MLKRLALGLFKGLLIGGALGAAFHFGLGWLTASGILAYLLAMGAGATSGILAGKPPWRHQAWIESLLKGAAGLGFGALAFWVASKWAAFGVPGGIPGLEAGTPWTQSVLLMPAVVAGLFGTLVELDNTDDPDPPKRNTKRPNVRVGETDDAEVVVAEVVGTAKPRERTK